MDIFFLSLFSFTSSLFFFSVLFLFFESEILVAWADLETEYIVDSDVVDSDVEFLIVLLPPLTCWKFSREPPRPTYTDRSFHARTLKIL